MPLTHRDYAALSADAYEDHKVGRRAPGQEEVVPLNGHNYKVLEHVNNRVNGYQGTIYQREDTGDHADQDADHHRLAGLPERRGHEQEHPGAGEPGRDGAGQPAERAGQMRAQLHRLGQPDGAEQHPAQQHGGGQLAGGGPALPDVGPLNR